MGREGIGLLATELKALPQSSLGRAIKCQVSIGKGARCGGMYHRSGVQGDNETSTPPSAVCVPHLRSYGGRRHGTNGAAAKLRYFRKNLPPLRSRHSQPPRTSESTVLSHRSVSQGTIAGFGHRGDPGLFRPARRPMGDSHALCSAATTQRRTRIRMEISRRTPFPGGQCVNRARGLEGD
jgi:hypothetical protein